MWSLQFPVNVQGEVRRGEHLLEVPEHNEPVLAADDDDSPVELRVENLGVAVLQHLEATLQGPDSIKNNLAWVILILTMSKLFV